ncbi:MAG TPA: GNAT family N-acetyltransferase [Steroidobacteraceae bacterium]
MTASQVDITQVRAPTDTASVRELFREYAAAIGVDLEYQGFSAELAALPGQYAPPAGELLLARVNGEIAGCVALRALDPSALEMKRLYVRASARGSGLGTRLVEAAITVARQGAYRELRLDTLASMAAAQALYRTLGFAEIAPYGRDFLPGTRFYALRLGG